MAIRLFDTHKIRKYISLDGLWDFKVRCKLEGKIKVPSCIETEIDALSSYRGTIIYTKEIDVAYNSSLRFYFEGVSFFAKVYLDNKFLGKHYNGYTPFDVIAKNVTKGKHTLKVVVSNKYCYASALHVQNDYYSYGGITRSVQVEYIEDCYIDNLRLIPHCKDKKWELEIGVDIRTLNDKDNSEVDINCTIGTKQYNLGRAKKGAVTSFSATIDNPIIWELSNPYLYPVNVTLQSNGKNIDDLTERVGFRTVSYDINGFYLNGKEVYIKGVNRHEVFDGYGCAVPLDKMELDIKMIKELNANAIRTAHYPNDSKFLDLCDENGLLVWEETHSRGLSMPQMNNLHFDKQIADCAYEMIKWHVSHPSIVIWGCLNECVDFTDKGRKKYKKVIDVLRSMDTSRPITFASCKCLQCKCLDLEDIVSYNQYYYWLRSGPEDMKMKDNFPAMVDWTYKVLGGHTKPIIMSEFGGSAFYGYHDENKPYYSEESQAEILEKDLDYYYNRKEVIGLFVWQYCDGRIDPIWYKKRPNGINSKGIVSAKREKKLAYYVVQKKYGEFR